MSALLSQLGMRAGAPGSSHGDAVSNLGPYFTIFNFVFAYAALSSRGLKMAYGIDHNVSPREDSVKYGERAVKEGKITQKQLNMLKRNEAAHANAVENFPLFVGSVLFATYAKVSNESINAAALLYTTARICYAIEYLYIDSHPLSYLRSLTWWTANFSCFYMLWNAGKVLS